MLPTLASMYCGYGIFLLCVATVGWIAMVVVYGVSLIPQRRESAPAMSHIIRSAAKHQEWHFLLALVIPFIVLFVTAPDLTLVRITRSERGAYQGGYMCVVAVETLVRSKMHRSYDSSMWTRALLWCAIIPTACICLLTAMHCVYRYHTGDITQHGTVFALTLACVLLHEKTLHFINSTQSLR